MSKSVAPPPVQPKEPLSARQAETVERLSTATEDVLRQVGYSGLTVRLVARHAGVAPATAYTYFSSREHLVTEAFLRRLARIPETPVEADAALQDRVSATLTQLALIVADEPELASACTAAMLADDPRVKADRDRIGLEWRRRLKAALGSDQDPLLLRSLEFLISGALLTAGMNHLRYQDLPEHLTNAARRLCAGSSSGSTP